MADQVNFQEAKVMAGRLKDGYGSVMYVTIDPTTGNLVAITQPHHEIHEGDAYTLMQSTALNALDIASPLTYHVVTPDTTKWAHLVFVVEVASQILFEIFEDDGNASHFDISGGSAATPINHNRNSSNTSDLTVKTGVTVTQATSDVLIYSRYIGGSGNFQSAGSLSGREEFILKQNTEYLFRVTTIADNNEGSFELYWYEHTNEN